MVLRRYNSHKKIGVCFCLFMLAFACSVAAAQEINNEITIYSSMISGANYDRLFFAQNNNAIPGYAIIHSLKDISLKKGYNKILMTDIPTYIDPTTFTFNSLSFPEATTLQDLEYHFDLLDKQTLLQRYLGQDVTVEFNATNKIESYKGKLLSVSGSIILENNSGELISLNEYSSIRMGKNSNLLFTQPTLVLNIKSKNEGINRIKTSYLTEGMSWWVEYNAVYKEDKDKGSTIDFIRLGEHYQQIWDGFFTDEGYTYGRRDKQNFSRPNAGKSSSCL